MMLMINHPWNTRVVRPRYYHYSEPSYYNSLAISDFPSIFEVDHLMSHLIRPRTQRRVVTRPYSFENDDFFKEFFISQNINQEEMETTEKLSKESQINQQEQEQIQEDQPTIDTKSNENEPKRSYSSYTYTVSTINENGNRIESKRKRYEDSNGRMKESYERRINDQLVEEIWNRPTLKDSVSHEENGDDIEEFEKQWKETPFAKLQSSKIPILTQSQDSNKETKKDDSFENEDNSNKQTDQKTVSSSLPLEEKN